MNIRHAYVIANLHGTSGAHTVNRWPALLAGLATATVATITTPLRVTFSDIAAAYIPAWQLAHHGTVRVHELPPNLTHAATEFHTVHGALVSDRMPGVILAMVPFSFTSEPTLLASLAPAFLCIVATVYLIGRLWGSNAMALSVLATPIVSIDRQLWPQTIILPLMLLCLYQWRTILPATAYITLCRPPTALLVIAVIVFWNRELRSAIHAIAGTLLGALVLLLYTHHYFGRWGLTGGYALDGHNSAPFLHSLIVGTISPQRGVLFYTPWIIAAFLYSKWRGWRPIVSTGALYTIAEWSQYNAFGGNGYLGYRYPLPFLLLCIGATAMVHYPSRWVQALMLWSIGINAYVLSHDHYQLTNERRDAWLFPHAMIVWGGVTLCFGLAIYGLNTLHRRSAERRLSHS